MGGGGGITNKYCFLDCFLLFWQNFSKWLSVSSGNVASVFNPLHCTFLCDENGNVAHYCVFSMQTAKN